MDELQKALDAFAAKKFDEGETFGFTKGRIIGDREGYSRKSGEMDTFSFWFGFFAALLVTLMAYGLGTL